MSLLSNGGINPGGNNQELNLLEQQSQLQQSQLQQLQTPHQPSMFRRILGGVAGMGANMFAPGLGGALGNLIGGGNNLAASGFAANAANFAQANELLAVAKQSNEDEEQAELASNLEKSKHETFMAIIQNIT